MNTKIIVLIAIISSVSMPQSIFAACYIDYTGSKCITADAGAKTSLTGAGWALPNGNEDKVCKVFYQQKVCIYRIGNTCITWGTELDTNIPSYTCMEPFDQLAGQNNWCLSGLYQKTDTLSTTRYVTGMFNYSYYVEFPLDRGIYNSEINPIFPSGDIEYRNRNSFASNAGSCGTTHPTVSGVCGNGLIDVLPELCDDGNVDNALGNCSSNCAAKNTFVPWVMDAQRYIATNPGNAINQIYADNYCKYKFQMSDASSNYFHIEFMGSNANPPCNNVSEDYSTLVPLSACGKYTMEYIRCNPGVIPLHPKIEFTSPTSPVSDPRVVVKGIIDLPNLVEASYKFSNSSAWTKLNWCGAPMIPGGKLAFGITSPKLNAGNYSITVKAITSYGYEFVSDAYPFTVASYPSPSGYPITLSYDQSTINMYQDIDPNPVENLFIYKETASGWVEALSPTVDTNKKTVTAYSSTINNDYALVYKNPSCLSNM